MTEWGRGQPLTKPNEYTTAFAQIFPSAAQAACGPKLSGGTSWSLAP